VNGDLRLVIEEKRNEERGKRKEERQNGGREIAHQSKKAAGANGNAAEKFQAGRGKQWTNETQGATGGD
jgi:hypothetical protein